MKTLFLTVIFPAERQSPAGGMVKGLEMLRGDATRHPPPPPRLVVQIFQFMEPLGYHSHAISDSQ